MRFIQRGRLLWAGAALCLLASCGGGGDDGDEGGGEVDAAHASNCFHPEVYQAVGRRSSANYRLTYQGSEYAYRLDVENLGQQTWLNQIAYSQRETGTIYSTTGALLSSAVTLTYMQFSANAVLDLGQESLDSQGAVESVLTFSPALESSYALAPNAAYTQTSTLSTSYADGSPAAVQAVNAHVEYLGQEDVTVPAGTFRQACKFKVSVSADGSDAEESTLWQDRSTMLEVKRVESDATLELASASINGVPVQP